MFKLIETPEVIDAFNDLYVALHESTKCDYDKEDHSVSWSKDGAFLIENADGDYMRLDINGITIECPDGNLYLHNGYGESDFLQEVDNWMEAQKKG